LQYCGETLVVDTIPVLDRKCVSQIQTRHRMMLKDQVKDLLLEFAAVDAVVLEYERNETFVIYDTMEERFKPEAQIVEREIQVSQFVCISDNLGESLG